VAGQRSRAAGEFSYRRPDIVSTTRPHGRGGHIYIRGYNFGTSSKDVSVYIGDQECRNPVVTQPHRVIRCYAPSGAADGKFHDLKVRVDGQSSSTSDGYASDRIQYTNTAPEFEGDSHSYVAVAGEALKIRLPTRDADGDDVYYRAHGLPEGALWRTGDGFMQIEYTPPAELLEYPHTEVDVSLEVSASDGPDVTKLLIDVQARACPVKQDACKDQSCATRNTMCPRCPISNVVRCSARRPILDPATGHCHSVSQINQQNLTVGDIAPAGYTFAVDQPTRLPLFDAHHNEAGALISYASKSLVAAPGPQPHDASLSCVEVAPCEHSATNAASTSIWVKSSGSYGPGGLYLTLPTFEKGVGPVASDGYGLCLGQWNKETHSWHCVDEHLSLHGNVLGGRVRQNGCFQLIADPSFDRPKTACTDCHSYDALNIKYLKKNVPAARELEHDECAKNQCPTIITTEVGDKWDARLP